MTPRQLNGYVELGYHRRMGWLAELLGVIRVANAGDKQAFTKFSKRLNDEAQ